MHNGGSFGMQLWVRVSLSLGVLCCARSPVNLKPGKRIEQASDLSFFGVESTKLYTHPRFSRAWIFSKFGNFSSKQSG